MGGAPHPHPLPPLLSRTTAMRDLPTGCRAGLWPKRHGAARTRGRAALQRREDVRDRAFDGRRDHGAGPGAIFRCHEDDAAVNSAACLSGERASDLTLALVAIF